MNLFQRLRDFCGGSGRPAVRVPDGPETPPIRMRCRFSGWVQGVGFRYEANMVADQLDLTGWVRNEADGSVTAELQGRERCINEFLRVMQAVPRFDITGIETETIPLSEGEALFRALY